jgi:hypothetical protein
MFLPHFPCSTWTSNPFLFPVLNYVESYAKIILKTQSSLKNPLGRQRPILTANSIPTITNKLDTTASLDLTSSSYLFSLKYSRNSIFDTIFAKTQASCQRHPSRTLKNKNKVHKLAAAHLNLPNTYLLSKVAPTAVSVQITPKPFPLHLHSLLAAT